MTDVLATERLVLRHPVPEDAVVYRMLWIERDDRVPPHRRIDADGRPTEGDIAARMDDSRLLTVVERETGDVIGYCGLVPTDVGAVGETELAFELLRRVHGRGFATEAGRAVLEAADAAGEERVWASVWDWNAASLRVLDKLGFRVCGPSGAVSAHGRTLLTVRER